MHRRPLATIAVLLARETPSLLIGEAAVPEQINKIYAALLSAIHLLTVHLGPDELLVAGKIGRARPTAPASPPPSTTQKPVSAKRATAPIIYLEPDTYRPETTVRSTARCEAEVEPTRTANGHLTAGYATDGFGVGGRHFDVHQATGAILVQLAFPLRTRWSAYGSSSAPLREVAVRGSSVDWYSPPTWSVE